MGHGFQSLPTIEETESMCGPPAAFGHNLIVVSVDDQGGHVDLFQVFGKVGFREGLDAVENSLESGLHGLYPEGVAQALGDGRSRSIGAVERRGEVLEELRTVSADAGADSVEDMDGQPARIGICLEHERGHGSNQNRFGNACGAVAPDIADHLSAAGGGSDVDGILQIQGLGEGGKIVGIGIHVVAIPWLAGSAVPAAVMADGAESMRGKKDHLVFPRVCAEGPAVAEDDRLTGAPVFVVDGGSVFGCDCGHRRFSLFLALIAAEADRTGLQGDAGDYVLGWHEGASRPSYPSVMLS